jgi:hypothetical protein
MPQGQPLPPVIQGQKAGQGWLNTVMYDVFIALAARAANQNTKEKDDVLESPWPRLPILSWIVYS